MIIDCHGHYTTVPAEMHTYREAQLAGLVTSRMTRLVESPDPTVR